MTEAAQVSDKPKRRVLWSANELLEYEFPAIQWVIPGLVPEGLTLLAGAPKLGKSWMGLSIATAVAQGGHVFGKIAVEQRRVLYLALEDTARRLQDRLIKIGAEASRLSLLDIALEWTRGTEAVERLRIWLTEHPETALIIVDTYVRLAALGTDGNAYREVTAEAARLKSIADETGTSILLIHHTRKGSTDGGDWMDGIMGSQALAGSVDTSLLLRRGRGKREAQLLISGRDVQESEFVLSFDSDMASWILEGTAQEVQVSSARQDILEWISANGPAGPKDIHTGMEKEGAKRSAITVRRLLREMVDDESLRCLGGVYSAPPDTHEQHELVNSKDSAQGVHVHGVHGSDPHEEGDGQKEPETGGELEFDIY